MIGCLNTFDFDREVEERRRMIAYVSGMTHRLSFGWGGL
jgi:hypothetical protein